MLRETEYMGFQHQMTNNPRRGFFGEKQIKLDSICKISIAFSTCRFPVFRKRFQNRDGKHSRRLRSLISNIDERACNFLHSSITI